MYGKYKYRFSIFTSTYNRADDLKKLYCDILNQTYKDFEWVVINDGSTDNTDEVMQSILLEQKIEIQYYKQPNGGKHSAWRKATELFNGQYITTFDDDDPIKPNALEIMNKYWSELELSPDYDQFWEIRTRCELPNGELVGKQISSSYFDSDCNEMTYKYGIRSEMNSCAKIEVLKAEAKVPDKFFLDDLVSNFAECIRWSRAARRYHTRYVPDITRTYMPNPSGYIKLKNRRIVANNLVTCIYVLNEQRDLILKYDIKSYFTYILAIAYYASILNISPSKKISHNIDKFFVMLTKYILWLPIKIKAHYSIN